MQQLNRSGGNPNSSVRRRQALRAEARPLTLAPDTLGDDVIALPWDKAAFRVADLRVPSYQRPVQYSLVRRIVNQYDARLMLPLVVNLRAAPPETAELLGPWIAYVIDGQQRLVGLREKGWEARHVSCIAYTGLTEQQEAFIYTESQKVGNRKNMQPIDHLRGAAAYGDPEAIGFIRTVEQMGIQMDENQSTNAWNLRSITTGLRVARIGEGHLARVLQLILDAYPVDRDEFSKRHPSAGRLSQFMLGGVSYFLRRFPQADQERLILALQREGLPNLIAKMVDYRRVVTSGRYELAIGQAMMQLYNGMSSRGRLHWNPGDPEG